MNPADWSRRDFFRSGALGAAASAMPARETGAPGAGPVNLTVKGERLHVETRTLSAVLEKGFLVSLESRPVGRRFISGVDVSSSAALQLLYPGGEEVRIDESKFGKIELRQVSPNRAEFVFHSWDGDGLLAVSADPETGALLLTPSAYSSRPGVQACRWSIKGIAGDLSLVAPFFQGVRLPLSDSLIRDRRFVWPSGWEAGLAILSGRDGGFWVHCQDNQFRYKALKVGSNTDPNLLAFDTEAYGPLDNNTAAGGLCWRINTYRGDWTAPAAEYRAWLWKAYGLDARERARAPWFRDVSFAISWCPGDPAILDAVAKRIDPRRVLIHFPDWRTDPYDENYPTFAPSEKARAFLDKGRRMGFHIMPHCNSIDMDPNHPVYNAVRDFQYRDLERRRLQGWSWYQRRVIGVPESNDSRLGHRDKKVMVKIHPGLSMWRSILAGQIAAPARELALESVFIDVTLNTFNLHNCLVENTTSTEGMMRLIDEVAAIGNGLVVGGEGLNETTVQGLSFAQAHLFRSFQENIEGVERTGGCPLGDFLWGRLCRAFGYSGLSGRTPAEELRMRLHEEHNAIPTLTVRSAEEILSPNPAAKRILDRAADRS